MLTFMIILKIYLNSILFSRNIRPKSTQSLRTPDATATLPNFVTSIPKSSPAIQISHEYIQQRLREESNSSQDGCIGNKLQVGRQGPIKDVKSLIDDFRQRHPEAIPRRGRRMKNVNLNSYYNEHGNAGDNHDALIADMLAKRNNDVNSPPSSNDSSYNNPQVLITTAKSGNLNSYGTVSASKSSN